MNTILPKAAHTTIDRYLNLPLGNKLVQCPYFKNRAGVRAGLRVYLGKGSVDEIIEETEIIAKKEKVDLPQFSEQEIREFMEKHNIGIDCSGFISQILWSMDAEIVKKIAKRNLFKYPVRSLIAKFRPIENISVKHLTNSNNCTKLNNWQEVEVGDIIKTRGGNHALLVTDVKRSKDGTVNEISYHHSTSYYETEHGVRHAKVLTIYPNEDLKDQEWEEKDSTGRNHTHEGLLEEYKENGVFRLKYIN